MEPYPVFSLKDRDGLFVVLQYPGLDAAGAVVVAPLVASDSLPEIPVLTPVVHFAGKELLLLTNRLAAVDVRHLGGKAGTLEDQDYAIARALSRLFFGN